MHPGTRPDELERLAGVEQIPGRVGLINVVREMDRLRMRAEQGKDEKKR